MTNDNNYYRGNILASDFDKLSDSTLMSDEVKFSLKKFFVEGIRQADIIPSRQRMHNRITRFKVKFEKELIKCVQISWTV